MARPSPRASQQTAPHLLTLICSPGLQILGCEIILWVIPIEMTPMVGEKSLALCTYNCQFSISSFPTYLYIHLHELNDSP